MLKMGNGIIIHDDNSTKVTKEIAKQIEKEFYHLEENQGKEKPALQIIDEKKE